MTFRIVRRKGLTVSLLAGVLACSELAVAQNAGQSRPREKFQNATVIYDWVSNNKGEKLRTFVTRPNASSTGKLPVIFFVGWLSCDSVEYPKGEEDGFSALILRLIDQSGLATVRMDKPGVGESQGDCAKTDLRGELTGYQAAFNGMNKYDFIDPSKVFVVGLSNGGGFSPVVTQRQPVLGYVSVGSWGNTWYEHMLGIERRRLVRERKKTPSEINAEMKAFTEFYQLYLMHGMTPGQIIQQRPEWKTVWYDAPDGQYGRPAAFYQQLQALNLGEAWQLAKAPALVVRGSEDWIMSRDDSMAIVHNVPEGSAKYVELEGMEHVSNPDGKVHPQLFPTVMSWLRERLGNPAR